MRKKLLLPVCISAICAVTVTAQNKITWEHLGNDTTSTGERYFTQRFVVEADGPFDGMAFSMFQRAFTPVDSRDTVIEILPAYYLVKSPRFEQAKPGEPITIDLKTSGLLRNHLYLPDGMHLVRGDKPVTTQNHRKSQIANPKQWLDAKTGEDIMIYGEEAYVINDSLRSAYRATPYGTIPTLKKLEIGKQLVPVAKLLETAFVIEPISDPRHDYWKATVGADGVTIATNSRYPQAIADRLKTRIAQSADSNGNIPVAEIEDWSDYSYRGFMLDVARNFLPVENVKDVIDYMSRYGLNILHFHLGEDEAWRLEIPSLPELTQVGSRRGYTLTDDVPFLKGIYSGDGNPDSPTVANGHYNVEEFIDILRYANSKGIEVIPEFDTPGHSRAAIKSMEWRYRTTGDESVRLIHDGDTSRYTSPQNFHDDVMNPAIEGPYNFWGIVMDDIIDIYKQAGVPLAAINIGGDEVAAHAWDGSEAARKLMQEKGMTHQRELHAHFVKRVAELAAKRGIKIAGWQEISLGHTHEYDSIVQPVVMAVNSWTKAGQQNVEMAQKGYNIVLSNANYLYFDHHNSRHPEEQGMLWGGVVDEFAPFNATLDTLLPLDSATQAKAIGVSAQVFAETVRDFPMVQRYMFPRILGLSERAHHATPTLTESEYFGLITQEMPRWAEDGISFYVRQPGITVIDGEVLMNDPYGMGETRYTTDGSEPTATSELYNGPIKLDDLKKKGVTEIRARHFVGGSPSSTSILYCK